MSELKIARGFALPLDLVTEATAIVATRGAGKSSTSAVIVEEGFAVGVQTVVFDRTGVYWGLRSNAKGDGPGLPIYVLGGPHGDVPLEPNAGVMIADLVVDSGHSFVLDLSDFSKAGAVRFAADVLERLYDRKARSRSTTLVVIDEAHFYAPQTPRGGFKGDSARLMGAMEDVVGLGRSRGLGVVLTTQRTQALNKAVLDLIETLLVMRMLSPRARAAVREWIQEKHEDDEQGVIASLDSLPTGTAWVWSPLRGILEKIAVRRIRTFDSYATPKPGETRVEPSQRVELDLDALGEQMRSTVERAKDNDPAELRKKLRELERQLAERPAEVETRVETVTERVEIPIPVFNGEVDRLEEAVGGLVRFGEQLAAVSDSVMHASTIVASAVAKAKSPTTEEPHHATTSRKAAASRQAPRDLPTVRPPAGAQERRHPLEAHAPRRQPAPPVRGSGAAAGDLTVSTSQQRILDALAALELIGVTAAPKVQLALFAQASPKSSGYTNNLGALRTAGLLDYPMPGTIALTDTGRALADTTSAPQTVPEMHDYVRALVGASRWRILEALIAVYPDALPKGEIAERAGFSASSSGYTNNLGSLRSLGLLDYPSPGYVAAKPVLFLEGA